MKIDGELILIPHPEKKGILINSKPFSIERNGWRCDFRKGLETDGASIPWPFSYLFGGKFNADFDLFAFGHDQWCGQFDQPYPVYRVGDPDNMRSLNWKEAACWGRDLLKLEDREANGKIRRKLFYQSIMLKKRVGQKK